MLFPFLVDIILSFNYSKITKFYLVLVLNRR
jgi:hypothetical protein